MMVWNKFICVIPRNPLSTRNHVPCGYANSEEPLRILLYGILPHMRVLLLSSCFLCVCVVRVINRKPDGTTNRLALWFMFLGAAQSQETSLNVSAFSCVLPCFRETDLSKLCPFLSSPSVALTRTSLKIVSVQAFSITIVVFVLHNVASMT